MLDDHDVNTEILQDLHFVLVGKQHPGRALRRKDFQRVRLESQNHGRDAELLGICDRAVNQSLMPQMYSIEISQGHHRFFQR